MKVVQSTQNASLLTFLFIYLFIIIIDNLSISRYWASLKKHSDSSSFWLDFQCAE